MSYLMGLTMGISVGRQVSQLIKGNGFSLIHALPGRRRYRYKDLLHNDELAARWQQYLTGVPGLVLAQVNPVTGSLLLEYTCQDEYIEVILEQLTGIHNSPEPGADYGKLGMNIQRFFHRLNRTIFQQTGYLLDLRTIIAVWMLIWGGVKAWTLGQRPSGPQMMWWAYSLLQGRSR